MAESYDVPVVAPDITNIDPPYAIIGVDVTIHIYGTGFGKGTVLVWNNADDECEFVSPTELTTLVRASMTPFPMTVPVALRNGEVYSGTADFRFVEAE